MKDSILLPINDVSQVAEARRIAAAISNEADFAPPVAGKVALVVTELANNIIKHGQKGELLINLIDFEDPMSLEVLAVDRGPGIPNIAKSLSDGHSTSGSSGTGLGIISRQADVFDIFSTPAGTAIVARIYKDTSPRPHYCLDCGVICIPMKHEAGAVSGDGWAVRHSRNRSMLMVCDGLGHGQLAAEGTFAAVKTFRSREYSGPKDFLEAAHEGLHHTRGAAVAVADVHMRQGQVTYAGIGNINSVIRTGTEKHMASYDGIVGESVRKVAEFSYDFEKNLLLVMHSDGISSKWALDQYPGLIAKHPAIIAAVIYRDFSKHSDDVAVLVGRTPRG